MRQNKVRKKKHSALLSAVILLLALFVCWQVYTRQYGQDATGEMVEYTVSRGTIQTYKSFSATLNVENSETITNTEGVTMVKELYVTAGQMVEKGDNIITLGTGKTFEASMSGTVNEIRFKKGDFVWPNITLAQICDLEHLEVQLQIDEYDIKNVQPGQACTVTIVPLEKEVETVISHVNRMSASSRGVAYYPATAKLVVTDDEIMPGMTVSVRCPNERVENAMVLPLAAISFDDNDQPCVMKKTAGGYEQTSIKTGLSDGMQIEIIEGVAEGESVYAPKVGTEEDETDFLTETLRRIFGTKTVIQPESTRDSRTGNRSGMPTDEMPAGFPGGMTSDGVPSNGIPSDGMPSRSAEGETSGEQEGTHMRPSRSPETAESSSETMTKSDSADSAADTDEQTDDSGETENSRPDFAGGLRPDFGNESGERPQRERNGETGQSGESSDSRQRPSGTERRGTAGEESVQ